MARCVTATCNGAPRRSNSKFFCIAGSAEKGKAEIGFPFLFPHRLLQSSGLKFCPPRVGLLLDAFDFDVIALQQCSLGQSQPCDGIIVVRLSAQFCALRVNKLRLKIDHVFLRDQTHLKTFLLRPEVLFGKFPPLARGLNPFETALHLGDRPFHFQSYLKRQVALARPFLVHLNARLRIFAFGLSVTQWHLQHDANAVVVMIPTAEPLQRSAIAAWKRIYRARLQIPGNARQSRTCTQVQPR